MRPKCHAHTHGLKLKALEPSTRTKMLRAALAAAAVVVSTTAAAAVAAAAAPASPCYAVLDGAVPSDSVRTIETPCATTLFDYADPAPRGVRLVLRAYAPAAAYVVEARVPDDPGASFDDNLFYTSSFLFDYLTSGNAKAQNLTATAPTAPLTLRPPVAGRAAEEDWVGTLALAPSAWPPAQLHASPDTTCDPPKPPSCT